MNENRAGLGYQDFEEVRSQHIFYIDKTDFIREWWEYVTIHSRFFGTSKKSGWTVIVCPLFWLIDILC